MPFSESDWKPASGYTNDTKAIEAIKRADAANNSAKEAIKDAQTAATSANTAETVAKKAAATAKSAVDNLKAMVRQTDSGIEVGMSADGNTYSTNRALMASDGSFKVIDKSGKVLASFAADSIDLGKDLPKSEITLCGGAGLIRAVYASAEQTEWREIAELYHKANGGVILQTKQGGDTGMGITENRLGDVTARIVADDFTVSLPDLAEKSGGSNTVSFISLVKSLRAISNEHDWEKVWVRDDGSIDARVCRIGKTAYLRMNSYGGVNVSTDLNNPTEFTTLPEWARPKLAWRETLNYISANHTGYAIIEPSGLVKIAGFSDSSYWWACTSYPVI